MYIETLNGWHITLRIAGSPNQYYRAEKGKQVLTSKDLAYIRRECRSR